MGTSLYIIENIYNPATFFCFFSLVACSFKEKEKKPRNFEVAWLIMLGLFSCFNYPLFGVGIKSPIDLFIGRVLCTPLCPSPFHNLQGFSARLLLGLWLLPQILLQKRIACVLYKLSFPYFQNSAISNLCSIGSPFDSQRWVSQK